MQIVLWNMDRPSWHYISLQFRYMTPVVFVTRKLRLRCASVIYWRHLEFFHRRFIYRVERSRTPVLKMHFPFFFGNRNCIIIDRMGPLLTHIFQISKHMKMKDVLATICNRRIYWVGWLSQWRFHMETNDASREGNLPGFQWNHRCIYIQFAWLRSHTLRVINTKAILQDEEVTAEKGIISQKRPSTGNTGTFQKLIIKWTGRL